MEIVWSPVDAARLLNVSRSVVHRLGNQYQTEASVSSRHVLGRPPDAAPAGDHESGFTLESDTGRLLIRRERSTRYHQSNTVERHSYQGSGIMDEVLDPFLRPYTSAIGNDFILMYANEQPHRALIVEGYLEGLDLERMEWPAQSPHLNPIEHI
ncbi:transposable element Tcb2 transposase [Trichonephila clavipes]|nr:transposable element Tcb2 transposase [Trichonephila clavipes]